MRLYLVRHATAFDRDPVRWPDDATRPLTERGVRRFRVAARGLRRLVPMVDVLLASPFERTRATADLLHQVARWPAPVLVDGLRSGAGPEENVAALAAHAAAPVVAAVGHEPHLHELASYLLAGDAQRAQTLWRKGAVAAFDLPDGPCAGGATLVWLLQPSALRRMAR